HPPGTGGLVGGLPVGERMEVLHRDRNGMPARRAERTTRAAHPGAALEVQRARHLLEVVRLLVVGGRDDVALLVLRDREQPVHLLDLATAHADRFGDALVAYGVDARPAPIVPHRG